MPERNDEQRAEARKLYEQDGFSLAQIARKINRPLSTVKTWKQKEGWVKGSSSSSISSSSSPTKPDRRTKRTEKAQNPNSLANLKPPFEPGNRAAVKHGLYANNSSDPDYQEFYDQAMESIGQTSQATYADAYANYKVAMKNLEKGKPEFLEPIARAATMVNSAGEKAVKNKMAELEMLEREQRASGTSPIIESIKEMTEGFMNYANEAHTETD